MAEFSDTISSTISADRCRATDHRGQSTQWLIESTSARLVGRPGTRPQREHVRAMYELLTLLSTSVTSALALSVSVSLSALSLRVSLST